MALTRIRCGGQLDRRGEREVDDGGLRRRVGLRTTAAAQPGDRRGVDDAAAAAAVDHRPRPVLDAEEHAARQDGERAVPVGDADLGDRPEGAADAGVVEHHVEAAEAPDRRGDELLDRGLVGDVGPDEAQRSGSATSSTSRCPLSSLRSPTTTRAPASRKRSTVARPMPLAPPVTMATRPLSTSCMGRP